MTEMTLIKVNDLSAFYDNREIFSGLSFSVEKGDYVCIFGENGSGKTTLMKCLLGLSVKHRGSIEYNGLSRGEIGWLPQRTEAQKDFPASVFEVVLSGLSGKRFLGLRYGKQARKKAEEAMIRLDILPLKGCSFRELSGGQQQRVLLCRALLSAGSVLLLDEPVTGLDSTAQKELYDIIKRLNREGMTMIMITHDESRALSEANKILHISENGWSFGTTAEYITSRSGGKRN